jgi:hypothetical protein
MQFRLNSLLWICSIRTIGKPFLRSKSSLAEKCKLSLRQITDEKLVFYKIIGLVVYLRLIVSPVN